MNTRWCFFFVAILSTTLAFENKKRDDACTTPDDKNGKCVPLNQCPIINVGLSSRNKTTLDFVRRSHCGFDEETLVCCEHPGPITSTDFEGKILLGNTVCGIIKEEPRIWGGIFTTIGEFPWMVGIEYKQNSTGESRGILCGGSLINDEFVLTAANCLVQPELKAVTVRLGDWDITKDPDCIELVANKFCADPVKVISIKEVIPHPFYTKRKGLNDIGLIRLEHKVKFTDFISPICLSHSKLPTVGDLLTVTGWGQTETGTASNILLKVTLPLVSTETCKDAFKNGRRQIGSHQICAGGELGKDSCQGDAGGPLMKIYNDEQKGQLIWYQYGIGSSGIGCGRAGYPGIYTKVSDYIDWIVNVVLENGQV